MAAAIHLLKDARGILYIFWSCPSHSSLLICWFHFICCLTRSYHEDYEREQLWPGLQLPQNYDLCPWCQV